MRTQSEQIAGVQVDIRFPEFGVDHSRFGGQVVTVIVLNHEEHPLHYVVGRSQLPEGVDPDSKKGQDAALARLTLEIEDDVKSVLAGNEVPAQKVRL